MLKADLGINLSGRISPPVVNGTIAAVVQDAGLSPVDGATVYVCPSSAHGTSGADGLVTLSCPIGTIDIRAAKLGIGFKSLTRQTLTAAETLNVVLTLDQSYQSPLCG